MPPTARRLSVSLSCALIGGLAGVSPAWGWGAIGHRVAAKVAEGRLTPEAKAALAQLLDPGEDLGDASNWPDFVGRKQIPESAPWHYVNVPLTEPRYDAGFCQAGGCVVSKIKECRKTLADKSAPKADRLLALRFLAHLVEDLHMPLHVGHMDDRGGNLCQVRFPDQATGSNLHRVWDSGVIECLSRDEATWVAQVEPLASPESSRQWLQSDVEDWATESLKLAHDAYYFPAGTSKPLKSGAKLGQPYADFAAPIIRRRLAQAGVRLAHEINEALR